MVDGPAIAVNCAGMADPAPVLQTFFVDDELKEAYQLDAVITVVDAKHIIMHLDEERPEGVENESGGPSSHGVATCPFGLNLLVQR